MSSNFGKPSSLALPIPFKSISICSSCFLGSNRYLKSTPICFRDGHGSLVNTLHSSTCTTRSVMFGINLSAGKSRDRHVDNCLRFQRLLIFLPWAFKKGSWRGKCSTNDKAVKTLSVVRFRTHDLSLIIGRKGLGQLRVWRCGSKSRPLPARRMVSQLQWKTRKFVNWSKDHGPTSALFSQNKISTSGHMMGKNRNTSDMASRPGPVTSHAKALSRGQARKTTRMSISGLTTPP